MNILCLGKFIKYLFVTLNLPIFRCHITHQDTISPTMKEVYSNSFGITCFQTVRVAPITTKMGQMVDIKDNNNNTSYNKTNAEMELDLAQEIIKE